MKSVITAICVIGFAIATVHGDVLAPAKAGDLATPRTAIEEARRIYPTKADQLEAMRQWVRESRYGQQGLDRIFKNFEGQYSLDLEIPGVEKNLRFLNSPSPQQAKGARRNLLYTTKAYNDPRFEVLGTDTPVRTDIGKTDIDLHVRHVETGIDCWVEIKDVSPDSQRADLDRIETQLEKIASECQKTGIRPAWVNRQETIPEIKEYALQRGIAVRDGVTQEQFGLVLDDLDSDCQSAPSRDWALRSWAFGTVDLAAGFYLTLESAPAVWHDVRQLEINPASVNSWLRLGQHSSFSATGVSMTLAGAGQFASRLGGSAAWVGSLGEIGEWAGPGGLGLYVVGSGFEEASTAWGWRQGTISRRQFVTTSTSVGTGLGFAAAGIIIGTCIEPGGGTVAGAAIGAFVGWPASMGTTYLVDRHFDNLDSAQQKKFDQFVYQYYGCN
jgi:hypothetical protein